MKLSFNHSAFCVAQLILVLLLTGGFPYAVSGNIPSERPSFVEAIDNRGRLWEFGGSAVVLALLIGIVFLRRRIRAKTAELNAALEEIKKSLAARQASEAELQESHELLSLVMRHSPVHIFIKEVTATESRVLMASDSFDQMIGFRGQQMQGKTMEELFPPEFAARISADDRTVVFKGEVLKQEEELNNRHYITTKFPIVRRGKTLLAGYTLDITEQKRAEVALRESEQKYRMLTETMKDVAWIIDAETLRFLYLSPSVQKLRGFTVEEIMAGDLTQALAPSLSEKLVVTLRRHADEFRRGEITSDTFFTFELRQPRKNDGTIDTEVLCRFWLNERTGKLELHGTTRDITERKLAEVERERLIRAIEQSTEMIVITDADANILYVNPEFTQTTGYTREETLGKNPRMLQSGQQDEAFYRQLWKTVKNGETWKGRLVNKRKDGTTYTEQASISPVRDETGRIINFVGVERDITQQLRDEEERTALQEHLAHVQKFESIRRLADRVAHDFNNQLQTIFGYTEIALTLVPPEQSLHADLVEIRKAAQHSAKLTRQLQTFTCKQPVTPKAININEVVENISSGMLRHLVSENSQLKWKPGANLGTVMIDPGQMDQIVANLCINARDAIEPSGTIVIETANVQLSPDQARQFGGIAAGAYVRLSVRDDGRGMSPEILSHLFEPFFTTKPRGQGTGLGLALVYGIVRQNGGHIHVDSAPGKGSVFQIYLPCYVGQLAASRFVTDTAETPISAAHETILLVDDEEGVLRPTHRMLESLGYQVLSTPSSKEALRIFEEHTGQIDLLLTDVVMPNMNGPEMVRQMLKQRAKLKYLFMSGYTANLLAEQGVNNNGNCIQKPFSRSILAQKVREVLSKRENT